MLAELPADGSEAVEELASADGPGHAGPRGPEVLHPAQGAAVEEDSGLTELWEKTQTQAFKTRAEMTFKPGIHYMTFAPIFSLDDASCCSDFKSCAAFISI